MTCSVTPRWAILAVGLLTIGCGPDEDKRNPVTADQNHLAPSRPAQNHLAPSGTIEVVIELDTPPGNVTVAPGGRVFFTFHPAAKPALHVAEALPDGNFEVFPDIEWQAARDDAPYFVSPLSLRADRKGRLWVLDHGNFGLQKPSLTAFDIATRQMVHRVEFPWGIAGWGSMLNDFWVDDERGIAYIADTSPYVFNPALVVYDINSRGATRFLVDHASVKPEPHHMVVQDRFLKVLDDIPLRVAVDSIALSADGTELFYGPLTGSQMYKIDTESLRDWHLDEATIASRVREHGPKPSTDGIAADSKGNLYLTAIEHDAVWVMRTDGTLQVLAQDPELLSWPDGVHLSPDEHWLYVTASELQHVLGVDLDELPAQRPFRILRIPL